MSYREIAPAGARTTRATTGRQRWLYAVANLGMSLPAQAVGGFLLFFYTDVRRLNPAWVATVMTLYAFYNAFNNPVLGYLSDRTRTRWGRRRPYIFFGALPYALLFAAIWFAPFDGVTQPVALLIYFVVVIVIWEGLATAVGTAYYALLPEMFPSYRERTDVAVRMNVVQTIGLLIGAALPPLLADLLGWPVMGLLFAAIAAAALYIGLQGMVERQSYSVTLPLRQALRETLLNRSFVAVVIAQTMRFMATGTLAAGMAFFITYSLRVERGAVTTAILATVFVTAGLALWPWRQFVAQRLGPRGTLMLAYAALGLAVLPLAVVSSVTGALLAAVGLGVAIAGLILMGDVILADVIDDDEVRTGQRREGMYFGMSGLITTLSSALVSIAFGVITARYGYDPALSVQPETVATGFRVFMTVPPILGAALALAALRLYPLHGARLDAIKRTLATRRVEMGAPAGDAPRITVVPDGREASA